MVFAGGEEIGDVVDIVDVMGLRWALYRYRRLWWCVGEVEPIVGRLGVDVWLLLSEVWAFDRERGREEEEKEAVLYTALETQTIESTWETVTYGE